MSLSARTKGKVICKGDTLSPFVFHIEKFGFLFSPAIMSAIKDSTGEGTFSFWFDPVFNKKETLFPLPPMAAFVEMELGDFCTQLALLGQKTAPVAVFLSEITKRMTIQFFSIEEYIAECYRLAANEEKDMRIFLPRQMTEIEFDVIKYAAEKYGVDISCIYQSDVNLS